MNQEEIVDAVRDWLDDDDWKYEYDAEHHFIRMGINLKSKIREAKIYVDFKSDCYLVYVVAPINADKDNLGEMLKYVAMANYGLICGNFEIDVADGEFRFKSYVNCEGLEQLPSEVIRESVVVGCHMMDRYGDGFAALAMGFSDAETEIKKSEKSED